MNSQIILSGFASGTLYALMGLGLVLLYKATRVLNFAHGEIGLFGTYVCYSVVVTLGLPVWMGVVAALLTTALLSLIIERTVVRSLGSGNMLPKAIATLGLFLALGVVMNWLWFPAPASMPGLFPSTPVHILGATLSWASIGVFGVSLLTLGALLAFFRFHPLGLVMRASADNAVGAEMIGIRPVLVSATVWALSGALAGLVGVMLVPLSFLAAGVMTPILLKGMAAAVVGGFDSLPGVMVGGIVIGVSENMLAYLLAPAWKTPFAFIVLFVVLLVAPRGIFAERVTTRV